MTLEGGHNLLSFSAMDIAGSLSETVTITLDTGIPKSPIHLSAKSKPAGVTRLAWQIEPGAVEVNTDLITASEYEDLPPSDGTWHYRVTTAGDAGNEKPAAGRGVGGCGQRGAQGVFRELVAPGQS